MMVVDIRLAEGKTYKDYYVVIEIDGISQIYASLQEVQNYFVQMQKIS